MKTVNEYINSFPVEIQAILKSIRKAIHEVAPEAAEGLSYKIPTYKQQGVLLSFAAYEKHIGIYPTPSAIEHFKDELAGYGSAKGSVQFPMDEPMPLQLIKQMVAYKLEEDRLKE